MDNLFGLIVTGIALEAFVQILKNVWDAEERSAWTYTRFAVVIIPVLAAFQTETNIVPAGLDLGVPVLGYFLSGLIVGRLAQFVHNIYKKTA